MPQELIPAMATADFPGSQFQIWRAGGAFRVDLPVLSGLPLGLGTAGQTLRVNAAATAIEWFSTWELISASSLSAVASIAVTGLAPYRRLRAGGYLLPATDSVNLFGQSSTNNGASYDNGAANYTYQTMRASGASTLTGLSANDVGLLINPGVTIGNAAGEGIEFTIDIEEFNQAKAATATYKTGWLDTAGARVTALASGQRNDTVARNAIRFVFSAGNIASGFLMLEGMRG